MNFVERTPRKGLVVRLFPRAQFFHSIELVLGPAIEPLCNGTPLERVRSRVMNRFDENANGTETEQKKRSRREGN